MRRGGADRHTGEQPLALPAMLQSIPPACKSPCPTEQALLLTEHLLKTSSQHVVQTLIDAAGAVEGLKQFKYLDEKGKVGAAALVGAAGWLPTQMGLAGGADVDERRFGAQPQLPAGECLLTTPLSLPLSSLLPPPPPCRTRASTCPTAPRS